MGRRSSIDALPTHARSLLERDAMAGRPYSVIAREHGVSRDAVRRHVTQHVAPAVRAAAAEHVEEATAVALAERIRDVANAARDTRLRLAAGGRDLDSLKAGESEVRALTTLAERLGVTRLTEIEQAREVEDIARAIPEAIRAHPGIATPLADALRARGQAKGANALEGIARRATEGNPT